jgi:hypothetical protein
VELVDHLVLVETVVGATRPQLQETAAVEILEPQAAAEVAEVEESLLVTLCLALELVEAGMAQAGLSVE